MTVKPIFGIDFGTTTTLVSRSYNDNTDILSIYLNENKIETVLQLSKPIENVGIEECYSRDLVLKKGSAVWDLYDIGNETNVYHNFKPDFTPDNDSDSCKLTRIWLFVIFNMIYTHVNKEDLSRYEYVIGVPAVWDKEKRDSLKKTALEAAEKVLGIESPTLALSLCPEPIAAVLNCRLPDIQYKGKYSLFFDFGGGTLDLSLVKVNDDGNIRIIKTTCNPKLGGRDFDKAFVDKMLSDNKITDPRKSKIVTRQAPQIKASLSSADHSTEIAIGDKTVTVTGKEYMDINSVNIQRITETLKTFFEDEEISRIKTQVKDITKIGGAVKMFFINDLLKEFFGDDISFNKLFDVGESQIAVVSGLPSYIINVNKYLKEKERDVRNNYDECIRIRCTEIKGVWHKVLYEFRNGRYKSEMDRIRDLLKAKNINNTERDNQIDKIIDSIFKDATEQYLQACNMIFMNVTTKFENLLENAKLFATEKFGHISMWPTQARPEKKINIRYPEKLVFNTDLLSKLLVAILPTYFTVKRINSTYNQFFSFQEPKIHGNGWEREGGFFYQIERLLSEQTPAWQDFWKDYQNKFSVWEDE